VKELLKRVVPRSLRERTYPCRERLGRVPGHLAASLRLFVKARVEGGPVEDLTVFEKRYRSQNGEDGIIEAIFALIGVTNRFFVEFGVEDGMMCNTRRLKERGWTGLQMDPRDPGGPGVKKEFVTAENIESLLEKYQVPRVFDLLSIDIDGNDYWVWKAIAVRRPRAVVIEYNATMPPPVSRTIPYDPKFRFDETDYFGASLAALARLGREKGYTLVACDSRGINAFFVDDALAGRFAPPPIERLYRPFGPPHRVPPHAEGRPWAEV
jgi:hypothetical protein